MIFFVLPGIKICPAYPLSVVKRLLPFGVDVLFLPVGQAKHCFKRLPIHRLKSHHQGKGRLKPQYIVNDQD